MPFFYVDWYYIVLVLPAVILSLWASAHVKSTFRRYSQVRNARGMTGAEAAMAVLRAHGVTDVRVEHVSGELTDHFDPKDHVIRLSDAVYNVATPAAVGVAAHEAGHAVQYARHYAPIYIRAAIVPVTNIGSRLSMPLIVLGLVLSGLGQIFYYVALAGVACYGLSGVPARHPADGVQRQPPRPARHRGERPAAAGGADRGQARAHGRCPDVCGRAERDHYAVSASAAHRGGREPEERLTMDERTEQGRRFLMGYRDDDTTEFVSDQEKKLPQPPLCKAPMGGERTVLPRDFSALPEGGGLYDLLTRRRSARIYTEGELSLLQLSFLLWATQGVRAMRGRAYATLRTVPSGGARHAFETYLVVRYVEGLRPGAYHYLPMEHALEFLHPVEQLEDVVSDTLCGQSWAAKASVIFYWSVVPYRAEWRYGPYAYAPLLVDAGHVGENLYLACASQGLGTCGLRAFRHELCCELFGLDGEEEFIVYAAPVGTVRPEDTAQEAAFYQFVEDENL